MNPNDIQDAKVGTRQVSAIYLGDTLVWPAVPMIYVITDAWLQYSSGSTINAAGSNYAYALGNVNVYRGTTFIRTIYDAHLDVSVSSQDFYVTRPAGLSYDVIKGNNLGTSTTSDVKTASVTASYRGDTHSAGSVTQERNIQTTTAQTVRVEGTPVITQDEVPNSRYVDLVISRYRTSNDVCPAYGGTANMSYSGGHYMANYSTTDWEDWTTLTHTFTSGSVVVDPAVITATGQYGPTMVGDPWGVADNISAPTLPAWLTFSNGVLTIASEGTNTYQSGRSASLTITNGYASDTETVYQQYNVVEEISYAYNLSVEIDVSGTIPSSGGVYSVDYVAKRTQSDVYTSGATYAHSETSITAEVSGTNCTPDTQFVTGAGTTSIEVDPNTSTILTKDIIVTLSAFGESASDTAMQDAYSPPVVATAAITADVNFRTGGIRMRLTMTSGTFPSNPVVISGITYHYVRTGYTTEHTIPVVADVTISDPRLSELISEIPAWSAGDSGTHWFSATSVSEIGLGNTTFPHTEFEVIST